MPTMMFKTEPFQGRVLPRSVEMKKEERRSKMYVRTRREREKPNSDGQSYLP
jgi:hypothetical protein